MGHAEALVLKAGRRWLTLGIGLVVLLWWATHRGEPAVSARPQEIVEAVRGVHDRARERAPLQWRLEVLGRKLSGEGAVAWSTERALLELHGALGVVEVRFLIDGHRAALAVPSTRTQYVGDRAGWALEALTGEEASLLTWLAMALDRPRLPDSAPSEVRSRGDHVEAVWESPRRRFVLDREGRVLGLHWGDVLGQPKVSVAYQRHDLEGRPQEIGIDFGSHTERLTLIFDRWQALPEDLAIPAPDEVPEGMLRRPLEHLGAGSWWRPLGLTSVPGHPEP